MEGQPYGAETRRKRWVTELADALTPKRVFRDYNYAVLDFTMLVCRPRNPRCDICPVKRECAYYLDSRKQQTSIYAGAT